MRMFKVSLTYLLTTVLSACVSLPNATPLPSATQKAINVSSATVITTSTSTVGPPQATATQSAPTHRPKIDPDTAITQAVATVEISQIVWSGSISGSVLKQLMSHETGDREAFVVPNSGDVFSLFAKPVILAAYIYEVPSVEKHHARFLIFEPGGNWRDEPGSKWRDELVPPFIYKMDLPLSWIGTHNNYGDYDQLIRNLEAQFERPILANKLSINVFSAKYCADADDLQRQLCTELARQGIALPVDYEAAQATVMDQWDFAIQQTATKVGGVEKVVDQLNAVGTTWWEDDRFTLFYLPHITVCLPDRDQSSCGTYISYQMLIDLGMLR